VHALCNVSSSKVLIDKVDDEQIIEYLKTVRDHLNTKLKKNEIVIYSIKPATKNFSTRIACSCRVYYYLIPKGFADETKLAL